jgi:hypothetical protein
MEYSCEPCGYTTLIKADYKRHLETKKHKTNTQVTEVDVCRNICEICCKEYASRGGLWKHNKQMHSQEIVQDVVDNKINEVKEEYDKKMEIMTKMLDTIMTIVEQLKQPQLQSNSNVLHENATMNNNSHNTVLMMLNTNHSHVISMDAFIKNMEVSLERTLSALDKDIAELNKDIFMDNLAGVSPDDRPIHCSDAKRYTYYVKGPTEWYKDHGEKLVKSIQAIFNLNIRKLMEWQKEHLLEIQNNDRIGTEFMKMFHNISGPENENDIEQIKNKTIALINQLIPISDVK